MTSALASARVVAAAAVALATREQVTVLALVVSVNMPRVLVMAPDALFRLVREPLRLFRPLTTAHEHEDDDDDDQEKPEEEQETHDPADEPHRNPRLLTCLQPSPADCFGPADRPRSAAETAALLLRTSESPTSSTGRSSNSRDLP